MVSSTVSSNYYFAKVRPPTHTHSTHPPKSKHQSTLCGFSAVRSDHNRAAPAGGGGTSKIPSLCPGPLTTESKGRPACRTAAARLMTRCARGGGWDAVRCQIGRKLASPPCGTLMCVCVFVAAAAAAAVAAAGEAFKPPRAGPDCPSGIRARVPVASRPAPCAGGPDWADIIVSAHRQLRRAMWGAVQYVMHTWPIPK